MGHGNLCFFKHYLCPQVVLLKKRYYRWYNSNSGNKNDNVWYKLIQHSDIDTEREWVTQNIYNGKFQGRFIEITVIDKYKN